MNISKMLVSRKVESKRMEKIPQENTKQKVGVPLLKSEKIYFQAKIITREKQVNFIMIKGLDP